MNKILLIVLAVSVCAVGFAYAGDSLTIGVSCTIPAIPGVNVPLTTAVQTQVNVKEEPVQEEKLIVVTQLDRTDDSKTVETIYSR